MLSTGGADAVFHAVMVALSRLSGGVAAADAVTAVSVCLPVMLPWFLADRHVQPVKDRSTAATAFKEVVRCRCRLPYVRMIPMAAKV